LDISKVDILSVVKEKVDNETFEELKKMISLLSHELKGALSSAVLSAYTLKDGYAGELTPNQQKIITSVVADLERMTETVKELLDKPRGKL
jgi:signal transduction histidine kinase